MPGTNYVIAACAHRAGNPNYTYHGVEGKNHLRIHLEKLLQTDTSPLAQITLLRALPLVRYNRSECAYYWDVNDLLKQFSCPVQTLDFQDTGYFSYGLWIKAAQKYKEAFDYYILVEDDYFPAHQDITNVLVDLHKRKLPQGGYLSSFYTDHPAVSNGITDSKSFLAGIKKHHDPLQAIAPAAQVFFGTKLFDHQADWTDEYRTIFGNGEFLYEMTHPQNSSPKQDLFLPAQFLGFDEANLRKCVI